jgi:hypothetical protein
MTKHDEAIAPVGSNPMLKLMLMIAPAILGVLILIIGLAPYKDALGKNYTIAYWFFLPVFLYLISTVFCILAQYTTCHTINMNAVLASSWNVLLFIYGALGISEIAAVRAPVVSIIPYEGLKGINDILTIEELRKGEFIREKATAYWLFWGILLGQMSAIGKSTICLS